MRASAAAGHGATTKPSGAGRGPAGERAVPCRMPCPFLPLPAPATHTLSPRARSAPRREAPAGPRRGCGGPAPPLSPRPGSGGGGERRDAGAQRRRLLPGRARGPETAARGRRRRSAARRRAAAVTVRAGGRAAVGAGQGGVQRGVGRWVPVAWRRSGCSADSPRQ